MCIAFSSHVGVPALQTWTSYLHIRHFTLWPIYPVLNLFVKLNYNNTDKIKSSSTRITNTIDVKTCYINFQIYSEIQSTAQHMPVYLCVSITELQLCCFMPLSHFYLSLHRTGRLFQGESHTSYSLIRKISMTHWPHYPNHLIYHIYLFYKLSVHSLLTLIFFCFLFFVLSWRLV